MFHLIIIFLMLILFAVAFVGAWLWFFQNKNGLIFCEKLYQFGQNAFDNGDYKTAKDYFKKTCLLSPTYKDARLKLSICYMNVGKLEKAEMQLQQILKLSPKNFDALLALAKTLMKLSRVRESEETYKLALKENEKSAECNIGLGLIYLNEADIQTALEYFQTAKELSKEKNNEIEFYINRCQDELCDYKSKEDVETIINKYLDLEREGKVPEEFNYVVAKAYSRIGKIDQATIYTKKALAAKSKSIEHYKLMSLIHLVKKDYLSAKTTAAYALKIEPKDDEIKDILSYIVCYQVENCTIERCRKKYLEMMDKS